jgi:hypothetical protein
VDADLAERFDLAAGPLLRVTLAPGTVVLTSHHLLSDGWSAPRILAELFALYAGTPLPPPVPVSRFTRWLAARDHAVDTASWRTALADLPEGDDRPVAIGATEPELFTVDSAVVAALTRAGAAAGLTAGTLLQGAWAAVLARRAGRPDVTFGVMVSGRTAEVDGVEEIIGLLANSVPVRARFTGTVAETLARVQADQQVLPGHVGSAELSALTGRRRLFDSLVVFENYPVDPARLREPAPGVRVTGARFRERTHHPVTVTVVPETTGGWSGVLSHQAGLFEEGEAAALVTELLERLSELPDRLSDDAADFVGCPE